MREIKFRAWYVPDKCWHYFSLTDLVIGRVDDALRYERWGQYTGLKDKNGKEIYEGDIIHHNGPWFMEEDAFVNDVATMGRFPRFWLMNEEFGYEGEDLIDCDETEVIGNIHENPEIVK